MRPILITTAVCAALILPRLGRRPDGACNPAVDHDAGQGRVEHRHAGLQGRRTEQGDRGEGLRLPRPDARRRGVRERLPGRFGGGHLQGHGGGRRSEQHGPDLLGADGCEVPVPDGQCGHHLFLGQSGRHQGADRRRDTAAVARRGRRHVVPVGHRLRPARSRPRRRGQVPVPAARLQGRGAGQRLLRPEDAHDPRHPARAVLPREQRPEAGGRADQEDAQGLSLPSRRIRHEHRLCVAGQGDLGAHAGPQTGLGLPAAPGAGEVHRRQRQGDEHRPAERLQLLRDAQRRGAEGARRARSTRRSWGRWPPSAS